jgi:hypothetical protein
MGMGLIAKCGALWKRGSDIRIHLTIWEDSIVLRLSLAWSKEN